MEDTLIFADDGFFGLVKKHFQKLTKRNKKYLQTFRNICKKEDLNLKHLFIYICPPYQSPKPTENERFLMSKYQNMVKMFLKRNKFTEGYRINVRVIEVTLKYYNGKFAIMHIERISKPGVRCYSRAKNLPKSLAGYGITIVSTSCGLMTDKEARQKKLGGEVLCQVW